MSSYKNKIDITKLPTHIAIIMDGNGRWAKEQGHDRLFGHQVGVTSVREITETAAEIGIKFLTLYTFSTENWRRPQAEVDALMELLVDTIERETPVLHKNNIRLMMIGDLDRLPENAKQKMLRCMEQTSNNSGLSLVLALSYSSRWEIINAVKNICKDIENNKLTSEEVTEELISDFLTTKSIPDPDLLIRTSGEERISNFLLWQIAYSELYFTQTHWPAFRAESLYEAIYDFQQRERRFGK